MTHQVSPAFITDLAARLFAAAGVPRASAQVMAEELTTSSLMGHDSHGALRIPDYLDLIDRGVVVPDAEIHIERTSPTTARVDCGNGPGAVGAHRATAEVIALASEAGTACVSTLHCQHVGRLGAYVESAARAGLIALATCNSPIEGHFVLPWGGRAGRLATNPIAYGVPTSGDPLVADFSTSVAPEGKIRFYRNAGQRVPEGWIVNAAGRPTTDPNDFYGPPRGGIMPLGGAAGHKGFALSLLVEILGSALARVVSDDPQRTGNGLCLVAIDPARFCPLEEFRRLVDETIRYVKSSPPAPGHDEVLMPGELEFRRLRDPARQVTIDEVAWEAIQHHAARLRVPIQRP